MNRAAPTLVQSQRWLKRAIEKPESVVAATLPPAFRNLEVYTDAFQARTAEALADTYETVKGLLGCEKFAAMNSAFLKRYPPTEYNLNYYGRELPRFLKKQPVLSELARLEWEIYDSFHARDGEPVFFDRFSGIAPEKWEKLRLKFQPSVKMLPLKWPVLKLWQNRAKPEGLKRLLPGKPAPQPVAVYRLDYVVFAAELDPLEFEALSGLRRGQSLGQLCGRLASRRGAKAIPLSDWFSKWASWGIFAGYSFK